MYFLLCLFIVSAIDSYKQVQTLEHPQSQVLSMELSPDNDILVAGCMDEKIYLYKNNGTRFNLLYSLEDSDDGIWEVDMTSDKQWLIAIDTSFYVEENSKVLVYRYNKGQDKFVLMQNITISNDSSTGLSGAITDDHEWIVFGKDTGNVYVYKYNGMQFVHKQTLFQQSISITAISLTNDHQYLAVSTFGNFVYIYTYNQDKFQLNQTITFTSDQYKRVFLTDNHEYLAVSGGKQKKGYTFKNNNGQFQILQTYVYESGFVSEISFSVDGNIVAVSYGGGTILYQNQGGDSQILLNIDSDSNAFSMDGKYFVVGDFGNIYIFLNIQMCGTTHYYNSSSLSCELCSQVIANCVECNNPTECAACDVSNDKFINNGSCLACQIEGCSDCLSLTACLSCNSQYELKDNICEQKEEDSSDGNNNQQNSQIIYTNNSVEMIFLYVFVPLVAVMLIIMLAICILLKKMNDKIQLQSQAFSKLKENTEKKERVDTNTDLKINERM